MGQITLYLDEATEKLMRDRAAALGLPYSRWVAQLIQAESAASWAPEVAALFGAFPEMPLVENLRADDSPEAPREPW